MSWEFLQEVATFQTPQSLALGRFTSIVDTFFFKLSQKQTQESTTQRHPHLSHHLLHQVSNGSITTSHNTFRWIPVCTNRQTALGCVGHSAQTWPNNGAGNLNEMALQVIIESREIRKIHMNNMWFEIIFYILRLMMYLSVTKCQPWRF